MLSNFESELRTLEEEARQREAKRAQEQGQADAICKDLRGKYNAILEAEKDTVQKRRIGRAIFTALRGGEAWRDPSNLTPDELGKYWQTTKTVDLGEEHPQQVRISAYGGKSPLQSYRTFVEVVGSSRMLEIGRKADGGVTWHISRDAENDRLRRGGQTGLVVATFYQDVYQKLVDQGKVNSGDRQQQGSQTGFDKVTVSVVDRLANLGERLTPRAMRPPRQ